LEFVLLRIILLELVVDDEVITESTIEPKVPNVPTNDTASLEVEDEATIGGLINVEELVGRCKLLIFKPKLTTRLLGVTEERLEGEDKLNSELAEPTTIMKYRLEKEGNMY